MVFEIVSVQTEGRSDSPFSPWTPPPIHHIAPKSPFSYDSSLKRYGHSSAEEDTASVQSALYGKRSSSSSSSSSSKPNNRHLSSTTASGTHSPP